MTEDYITKTPQWAALWRDIAVIRDITSRIRVGAPLWKKVAGVKFAVIQGDKPD